MNEFRTVSRPEMSVQRYRKYMALVAAIKALTPEVAIEVPVSVIKSSDHEFRSALAHHFRRTPDQLHISRRNDVFLIWTTPRETNGTR